MKRINWHNLATFFESGDLVPFAVLTSVWHFVMAVKGYGEAWPTAVATGIFVDMLHFRTVRMAVNRRSRPGWLIALVTTAVSFGFHILFYMHGDKPFDLIMLLLAAPLPLGIPVLAWQQSVKVEPLIITLAKRRVKAIAARARYWQKQVKVYEAVMKQHETAVKRYEVRMKELETQVKELESTVNLHRRMMKKMNPVAHDVALMMAGAELTGQQIAEKHGVSTGTVSGIKAKMNGAK